MAVLLMFWCVDSWSYCTVVVCCFVYVCVWSHGQREPPPCKQRSTSDKTRLQRSCWCRGNGSVWSLCLWTLKIRVTRPSSWVLCPFIFIRNVSHSHMCSCGPANKWEIVRVFCNQRLQSSIKNSNANFPLISQVFIPPYNKCLWNSFPRDPDEKLNQPKKYSLSQHGVTSSELRNLIPFRETSERWNKPFILHRLPFPSTSLECYTVSETIKDITHSSYYFWESTNMCEYIHTHYTAKELPF